LIIAIARKPTSFGFAKKGSEIRRVIVDQVEYFGLTHVPPLKLPERERAIATFYPSDSF
jgi:hypothetical protein